tara:strand:+ start:1631 stop:1996 length:366 start_codon:yes stop_codon:yes gene_type:complete
MDDGTLLDGVEEATLAFSLGDVSLAASILDKITKDAPDYFEAWHALTEVRFAKRDLEGATHAGEQALRLQPSDLHVHVSLSRIWAERGDKKRAEEYGAKARVLGWQAELDEPVEKESSPLG